MNQIDIRTHDDIQRLTGAIQELKEMLLLIYSDQCGHCHTYRPFWNKLHNVKNRKLGLVSVERNMLPHTPWANVEHRGYPSVIEIDKNGVAHPVEQIRDEKKMNAVVNGNTEGNEPELEESSSDEEYPNNRLIIGEKSTPLSKENYEEFPTDPNVFSTNAKINTKTNANLNNLNSQKQNSNKYRGGRNNNEYSSSSESEEESPSPKKGGGRRPKKRISKKKTIRKRRGRKHTRRQKQKNLKRR